MCGIAADVFAVDAKTLDGASSPEQVEAWDSVQHLNLVLELEMTFGVKFTTKEQSEMLSIGGVATTVERKLGRPSV